ncbi:MAG TPA: hypothetical protein PKE26_10585, partial [Kiritimatiellia bacterium]|nr:hypothetical protein [Kiritimatiellia bacterium]
YFAIGGSSRSYRISEHVLNAIERFVPPAPRAAFDAVWEPGGKPSAGSRLSQRAALFMRRRRMCYRGNPSGRPANAGPGSRLIQRAEPVVGDRRPARRSGGR